MQGRRKRRISAVCIAEDGRIIDTPNITCGRQHGMRRGHLGDRYLAVLLARVASQFLQ